MGKRLPVFLSAADRLPWAWVRFGIRSLGFMAPAAIVMLAYLVLVNNYFKNVDVTIHADGVGYYDYLPSIFLRHDIDRRGKTMAGDPDLYAGVRDYPDYPGGRKLNKYGCGTALLQAPFFAYALCNTPLEGTPADGFQPPFQKAVFHAALFYLFLSLLLLHKILDLMAVRRGLIFLMQLLLGLGTTVTHYANDDASYSHIYSLFAISGFIYCAVAWFRDRRSGHLAGLLIFLGLIFLTRQVDLLVVLLLPYLAGSWSGFKQAVATVLSDFRGLGIGLGLMLALVGIQSLLWYLQVGAVWVYSYGEEGFNFLEPKFFKVLFSYQKGLFVYTPVLLVAMSGIAWLMWRRKWFQALSWLGFLCAITYVFSSWWSWFLGCSYGHRAYIEFYPAFFIPFALFLDRSSNKWKYLLLLPALACIPLNVVQGYQYKKFILHWEWMDGPKYWDVFLRTDKRFNGMLFRHEVDASRYRVLKEIDLGDVQGAPNTTVQLLDMAGDSLPDLSQVQLIRVELDSDLSPETNTTIVLTVDAADGSTHYFWNERPLLHYRHTHLGQWQRGYYNYRLKPIPPGGVNRITFYVATGNFASPIRNVKLQLWSEADKIILP